jgi:putative hydrolase of the HAD superfamily
MRQLGFDGDTSARLADAARRRYVDPSTFRLFDDARPALERLAAGGWRHIVLSNHVPELESIVDGVGLGDLVEAVLSSAQTGYEKPHPEAFAIARREAGNPAHLWMVGDNPDADVLGAEAVGIPAILVRTEDARVNLQAPDLASAASILEKASVGP